MEILFQDTGIKIQYVGFSRYCFAPFLSSTKIVRESNFLITYKAHQCVSFPACRETNEKGSRYPSLEGKRTSLTKN